MKRMKQESYVPRTNVGELKLDSSTLDIKERYWVFLTAHNEKLSSKKAVVDFQPMDPAGNHLNQWEIMGTKVLKLFNKN